MSYYDDNPNWALEAVQEALRAEKYSTSNNDVGMKKVAEPVSIGTGAIIGGLATMGLINSAVSAKKDQEYKTLYGNSVARLVNEQNKKMIDLNSNYYSQIDKINDDLKIIFSPFSVAYMLKNTVVDTISVDIMNAAMKDAWRRKDQEYFKNVLINKIYLESQLAEQMFLKRLIETDDQLKKSLFSKQAFIDLEKDSDNIETESFILHPIEQIEKMAYFQDLFTKAMENNGLNKFANMLFTSLANNGDEAILIPTDVDSVKYADDNEFDLGIAKIAFLGLFEPNDKQVLNKRNVIKNAEVSFLPDRVLYILDNIVITQLSVFNMNEEAYGEFVKHNARYFKDFFVRETKKVASVTDEMIKEALEDTPLSNQEYSYRKSVPEDAEALLSLLENINEDDKKFLAYNAKKDVIRNNIKSGRHIYIAEHASTKAPVGFLRESGRPDNTAYVEELYVLPEHRKKGIASTLIDSVAADGYDSLKMKALSSNEDLLRLVNKKGFILNNGPRISEGVLNLNKEADASYLKIEKEAAFLDKQDLFLREDIHPMAYFIFMNKEFGEDWLDWDYDTLKTMIEVNYDIDQINQIVLNKLMFIIVAINSDTIFEGFHTFEKAVRAFNGRPIDFEERESNLKLSEIVFTLRLLTELLASSDDDIYDNFNEHVFSYLVEVLADNDYRVCAHKTKSGIEKSFWDVVNVELLEDWAKALPTGLFSTGNGGSESLYIQKLVKRICEKFKPDEVEAINSYIRDSSPHKGENHDVFSYIIKHDVQEAFITDVYVEGMNRLKEEHIKMIMSL